MKKPLVSVIIPVYNVKEYLKECIDSILTQVYTNLEVLLVDDGSTDGSGDMCDEYAELDKRIKVIHQKNQGVSSARNRALNVAKGEYVLFVDSDDVALKGLVNDLVQLSDSESIGMVSCQFTRFHIKDQIKEVSSTGVNARLSRKDTLKELFYGDKISSGPHCKLIRRSTIGNVRFDESLIIGEDFDFLGALLLGDNEFEVFYTNQTLYGYRMREGSAMTSRYREGDLDYLRLVQKWGERALRRYPEVEGAVAYRLFGVASFCAGKLRKSTQEHREDINQCIRVLKKYSKSVLFDLRTSPKDRCLALAYMVNPRLTTWLRRVI